MIDKKEIGIVELQKRALYFYKEKKPVHIKMNTGFVYNGIILEFSEGEFIILIDRKVGEMPIFFTEIKVLEGFREE